MASKVNLHCGVEWETSYCRARLYVVCISVIHSYTRDYTEDFTDLKKEMIVLENLPYVDTRDSSMMKKTAADLKA